MFRRMLLQISCLIAVTAQLPLNAATGPELPKSCTVGDLFFLTSAPAGANLYGCSKDNTWTVQGTSSGSSGFTIASGDKAIGTRPTANLISGPGIITAATDTGSQINIQQSIDSAIVLTRPNYQSGQTVLCASSGKSGAAYTCAMSPTLTKYQQGMVINWVPDVDAAGAATLNIDTLGAKPVKLSDGVTDPAMQDLAAGRMYPLWFDGTVFRVLVALPAHTTVGASRPACNAALRGRLWQTLGAAGVKDEVAVCAKDASDAFAWRTVY